MKKPVVYVVCALALVLACGGVWSLYARKESLQHQQQAQQRTRYYARLDSEVNRMIDNVYSNEQGLKWDYGLSSNTLTTAFADYLANSNALSSDLSIAAPEVSSVDTDTSAIERNAEALGSAYGVARAAGIVH